MDRAIVVSNKQYNIILAVAAILGVLAGFFGGECCLLERQISQAKQARIAEYIQWHREALESRLLYQSSGIIMTTPEDASGARKIKIRYR